jgi:endonuclease YncB( thermonuclease family)
LSTSSCKACSAAVAGAGGEAVRRLQVTIIVLAILLLGVVNAITHPIPIAPPTMAKPETPPAMATVQPAPLPPAAVEPAHLPIDRHGPTEVDRLTVSGPSRVIDGDTVVVAGVHVRLKGVDAAEMDTAPGQHARQVMLHIVNGSELRCLLTGEHTWRREVGYCSTADGTDINRAIIEQGAALACPRYSERYVRFEQAKTVAAQTRASFCVRR